MDRQRLNTDVQRLGKEAIRRAAQKWLIAVVTRIPIRTGFLSGSFTPLENLVGVVNRDTGRISLSRNPLVTRERKIASLAKRIKELQKELSMSELSYSGTTGGGHLAGGREEKVGGEEGVAKKSSQAKLDKDFHRLTGEEKLKRDAEIKYNLEKKRLARLEARLREALVGRSGGAKVAYVLEMIRQKRAKMGKYLNKIYNPITAKGRARYMRDYVEVKKVTERIEKAEFTQKEKIAALRAGKRLSGTDRVIQEEITTIEKQMQLYRVGYRIRAFKEIYIHTDKSKTLKTPRSGIRFVTPEDKIFQEAAPSQAQQLMAQLQLQQEATARFLEEQQAWKQKEKISKGAAYEAIATGIEKRLDLRGIKTSAVFSFQFKVDIQYMDVNDLTAKIKGAPWYAYAAGDSAFAASLTSDRTWETQFRDVTSYVLTRTLTFNGESKSEIQNLFRGMV